MLPPIRIGNAQGFWGDSPYAPEELLAQAPDLDVLTLDYLAEVSMSILAHQRKIRSDTGFPLDFFHVINSLIAYWQSGGKCRLISNAGGLDPRGCAEACRRILAEDGCDGLNIGIVLGDDVLESVNQQAAAQPDSQLLKNLDDQRSFSVIEDRILTANAYLGSDKIVEALSQGADIVITGRVADPSMTVAACVEHFGWKADDWNQLAGATIAGHLIECGTQVSGGIFTDWLQLKSDGSIGFPIVEVFEDGSCVVTKPAATGGCVTPQTVKEQLVYEIGNPDAYLSPDVTVSFASLQVQQEGVNRVRVSGAVGTPAPKTYKVSATYQDGFRSQGQLTMFGSNVVTKARRAGDLVLEQLRQRGITFRDSLVECLGANACHSNHAKEAADLTETVLRISVHDDSPEALEQFSRSLMPLVTCGPPGTTGYAEGRPRIHPLYRFWPCLIDRDQVSARCEMLPGEGSTRSADKIVPDSPPPASRKPVENRGFDPHLANSTTPGTLETIAHARSGDKGIHANIGVIARRAADYQTLHADLTARRVAIHLGIAESCVIRYELPNLGALNFVVHGILANPLRVDVQGKALGQVLLQMPWPVSQDPER